MTSSSDMAGMPQIGRQNGDVAVGLLEVFRDLQGRAESCSRLLHSAQAPRHDNGIVHVSFPAVEWFAAIAADSAPRPGLAKSRRKPLADWTEVELREFVRAEFARPPSEPI